MTAPSARSCSSAEKAGLLISRLISSLPWKLAQILIHLVELVALLRQLEKG